MVNRRPYGIGLEGAHGLAPQVEPLLLQIPHQNIQEGGNTKEYQQDQKTPPLCFLNICNVPQEAMDDQRKTLKRINQEALGDQTQGHDLN